MSLLKPLLSPSSDPLNVLDVADDFIAAGVTAQNIGTLGWHFTGGTVANQPAESGHPGIMRRATSSSINTVALTRLLPTSGASTFLPAEDFSLWWVFRLNQTDANTEARLGVSRDWTSLTPADGIYLEKKAADTEWFGVCRASSTESRTASLATTDTGWHTARVRRIDDSTIGFSLDGGAEIPLTTDIPTLALYAGFHITNTAAADKTMDVDLFRLRVSGLGR